MESSQESSVSAAASNASEPVSPVEVVEDAIPKPAKKDNSRHLALRDMDNIKASEMFVGEAMLGLNYIVPQPEVESGLYVHHIARAFDTFAYEFPEHAGSLEYRIQLRYADFFRTPCGVNRKTITDNEEFLNVVDFIDKNELEVLYPFVFEIVGKPPGKAAGKAARK